MSASVRDFVVVTREIVRPIRDAMAPYDYFHVQDSIIALRPFSVKRLPLSSVIGSFGPYVMLTGRRRRYTIFIDDPFNGTSEPVRIGGVHALLYPLTKGAPLQPFDGALVKIPCIVPLSRCTFVPHVLYGAVASAQKYFVPCDVETARALLLSAVNMKGEEIRHFDEHWDAAVHEVTRALLLSASTPRKHR